jgi:hypothetical protein
MLRPFFDLKAVLAYIFVLSSSTTAMHVTAADQHRRISQTADNNES